MGRRRWRRVGRGGGEVTPRSSGISSRRYYLHPTRLVLGGSYRPRSFRRDFRIDFTSSCRILSCVCVCFFPLYLSTRSAPRSKSRPPGFRTRSMRYHRVPRVPACPERLRVHDARSRRDIHRCPNDIAFASVPYRIRVNIAISSPTIELE